jgi:putative oxidoreductase
MSAHSQRFPRPFGDTDDVVGQARSHATDPGHSIFHRLIATNASWATSIARITLGLVMLPHALQKTVGLFGGKGFGETIGMFTSQGLPAVLAFLVIAGEFCGAVALVIGGLTRVGAVSIGIIMAGAIATVHAHNGFFMNWMGAKGGEGFEYHLLALALSAVCLLQGGGRLSIDRLLSKWRPAEGGGVSPVLNEG